jgi:purine-binding chemotaxis protein CheW
MAAMTPHGTMLLETSSGPGVKQYLSFALGAEEYGLEILRVQEIKGYLGITPIPNSPPHIRGVMNLRGTVIPVIDLRLRFGMEPQEYTRFTVIIVVTMAARTIGLIVDAVSDVLDIRGDQVRPAPDMGAQVDTRFIAGMVANGDQLVVLLDVDRLLADDGLTGAAGPLPASAGAAEEGERK